MPRKDREAQNAYQREWYARKENRERTKAKTKARKHNEYGGKCLNCGGPTIGYSPGKAAEYCSKSACHSAQRKAKAEVFREAALRGLEKNKQFKKHQARRAVQKQTIVSLEDLARGY